jgi:acetyl esterase/lipase
MPEEAAGRPPLIVWIHGGGWRRGSKNNPRVGWLPDRGYAMASISYRLSHQAVFPAQIHDCKGAIRWLRAHADKYGYDATRIGIAGGSAGGHLCALLGATGDVPELEGDIAGHQDQSSRVQAVLDYFGPADFTLFFEHIGEAEKPDSPLPLLLGGPLNQRQELARLASPALHVTPDDPPLLILHGTDDPLVPLVQSRHLHDRYLKAGLESTLHVIEGGRHGGLDFYTPQRQDMVTAFFDRHIRKE